MVAAEDRQVTLYLLPTVEEGDEHHIPPVIGYLSGHKNRQVLLQRGLRCANSAPQSQGSCSARFSGFHLCHYCIF